MVDLAAAGLGTSRSVKKAPKSSCNQGLAAAGEVWSLAVGSTPEHRYLRSGAGGVVHGADGAKSSCTHNSSRLCHILARKSGRRCGCHTKASSSPAATINNTPVVNYKLLTAAKIRFTRMLLGTFTYTFEHGKVIWVIYKATISSALWLP